jgi:hypothetical protein
MALALVRFLRVSPFPYNYVRAFSAVSDNFIDVKSKAWFGL